MKNGLIALGAVFLFMVLAGYAETPAQYCKSLLKTIDVKCKSACPKRKSECMLATYKAMCEGKEGATKGCKLYSLECIFECANLEDKEKCNQFENCQWMKDHGLAGCFDKK